MPDQRPLAGKRVTVMGLGRFGGGLGAARFLAERGARVTVTDLATADRLAEPIDRLRPLIDSGALTLHLGAHEMSDFIETDLVVASPAVPKPWENEFLIAARAGGVPITTEIGLLAQQLGDRSRIVGVTGSAGKSTTAAMTAHAINRILRDRNERRRAHLGGNIGGSLLTELDGIAEDDLVVLELSSAMLHWLDQDGWSPGVAAVTNLAENHMDWHGDMAHYERSKRAIIEHQRPGDVAILPGALSHWFEHARAAVRTIDPAEQATCLGGVRLRCPGAHNRDNAHVAAIAASEALERAGVDATCNRCARTLEDFHALPHRLQPVAEGDGVRAINDSKSTTPESTKRAVEALLESGGSGGEGAPTIHLICGGSDKGADWTPLVEAAKRCAAIYTIGLTGPAIAAAIRSAGTPVIESGDLPSAVVAACDNAAPGSILLLSPACASFDHFSSYAARGEAFTTAIRREFASRSKTDKNLNKHQTPT